MATQTAAAAHTLPPLPYPHDALEPHIDARTMEIHHGKHHQTYVNNLNAAIEKAPEISGRSLEELLLGISRIPEAVRRSEEHTSELQSRQYLVCRLLLEKKK